MKKLFGTVAILGVIFMLLHSTPKMALKFHIFLIGYPKEALITDIRGNITDNGIHKAKLASLKANTYTLTKPPFEKDTETKLDTFLIRKIGFLYFAEYYSLL